MAEHPERTPSWLREHGNHLAAEPSLYLRQHAHNPLDWYPWGDEALARARDEDKPIFLSVGYSSCHWCHVMEHEVFEDDETAAFLNEHYVAIKVDREERPDLDQVYMDAVNLMTGRGGWPMSVFLTPEGKPFHGGTYYPRPHFLELVQQIERIWRDDRAGVERQAAAVSARIAGGPVAVFGLEKPETGAFRGEWIDAAIDRARQIFDEENGGFLQQQKFPTPVKWRFLLRAQRAGGDADLARRITRTCEAMTGGGLRDQLGGGFHRYTVDPDWTVPHFEKMLYDNGQIISLLLEAGVALERPDFVAAACDALDFLLREMRSPEGAFYASFDADSGGEEGSYYVWSRAEIIAVVGETDGPALADVLGVDEAGNFEHTGKSVLTQRADLAKVAEQHGRPVEEIAALFAGYRDILRAARAERTPPGLDRKVVTSWNALAITALVQAHAATSQREYLDAARRAADFLLTAHRDQDGVLWRASTDGATRGRGILDDHAFLADALLDLFQAGGETRHLAAARELVDRALDEFGNEEGGYHLSARDVEAPLGRAADVFDSVEPSGSAALVQALIRLSALTGQTKYRERAQRDLESQASLLERAGLEMSWWLAAGLKLVEPLHEVVVAGDPDWPSTRELVAAALSPLSANLVVCRIDAAGADAELLELAPALAGKTAQDGRATAYVCEFGRCDEPTGEVAELKRRIDPAAARPGGGR